MANIDWTNATAPQISFAATEKTREEFAAIENKTDGQIVFLVNDKTIYFKGEYFGLSASDADRLNTVISDLSDLKTDIGTATSAYATLKNSQQTLAQGLLSLKTALDEQIGNTEFDGASITAAIATLQTSVSGILGDLYATDIPLSTEDNTSIKDALDGKVLISVNDTTDRSNSQISGSDLTTTTAIADAIEGAHAAAVAASGNADTKIAKSSNANAVKASGASSSITGITPNSLEDGEDIAQAIEDAIVDVLGSSENWNGNEAKTLGQLRTLIANLNTTVTGLDDAQANRITNIIQELINGAGAGTDANSFVNTMIDKLLTLMAYSNTTDNSGQAVTNGGGYYNIENGDGSNYTYANTIQGIIDALESLIATKVSQGQQGAIDNAVTSVKATGATVSGTALTNGKYKGDVELTIDSSTVKLKSTLTGGVTTVADNTIQTAFQDLSNAVGSAQSAANTALNLLQWQVI